MRTMWAARSSCSPAPRSREARGAPAGRVPPRAPNWRPTVGVASPWTLQHRHQLVAQLLHASRPGGEVDRSQKIGQRGHGETVDRPRRLPASTAVDHRRRARGYQDVPDAQTRAGEKLGRASPPRSAPRRLGSTVRRQGHRRPRPTHRRVRPRPPAVRWGCGGSSATAGRPRRGCNENSGSSTRPPISSLTKWMASAPPLVRSSWLGSTPMAPASAAVARAGSG